MVILPNFLEGNIYSQVVLFEEKEYDYIELYHNGIMKKKYNVDEHRDKHGKCVSYDEYGDLESIGTYISGKRNGKWNIYYFGVITFTDLPQTNQASLMLWSSFQDSLFPILFQLVL